MAEADLRHIAECLGEDPDDVPEGHRLVDHLALRVGYLRGRDAGFDDVEAERDTLAATLAHVEALAERWEAEDGEAATARDLTALNTINRLGSDLRAALAGPTALDAMGADQ